MSLVKGLVRQCGAATARAAPGGSCVPSLLRQVHRAAATSPRPLQPSLLSVQHASSRQLHQSLQVAAAAPAATDAAPAAAAGGPQQQPTSNLVTLLRSRGLVQDVTSEELHKVVDSACLSLYCGFDPTADSLHLGNLLGIIVLAWAGACGHTPIALLGGATGRVGDPSGRSSERPVLSEADIQHNIDAIGTTLRTILARASTQLSVAADGSVVYGTASSNGSSSGSGGKVNVLNNLDWFGPMSFLDFLRDIGKFARVGQMLAKDSVRSRMESESGISFTEFTYQLLQGYDFVHLARNHGVRMQIGGSDQWGNITAGTDLIRKLMGGDSGEEAPQCFGLTFPLLVDSEGRKFGKSTGGAIWLSAEKLSPYKFYQYLFQVTDADVIKFLRMLTFLPLDEIDALEQAMSQPDYVPNTAQKRLAEAVTRFVHGDEGLEQALKATEALRPGAATALDAVTLEAIAGDAPSCSLAAAQVSGLPLIDVMVASGMLKSKGEVKRLIKGGGVYLNNAKVTEHDKVVRAEDLIDGKLLLLAAGKKNKMLVRISG